MLEQRSTSSTRKLVGPTSSWARCRPSFAGNTHAATAQGFTVFGVNITVYTAVTLSEHRFSAVKVLVAQLSPSSALHRTAPAPQVPTALELQQLVVLSVGAIRKVLLAARGESEMARREVCRRAIWFTFRAFIPNRVSHF